MSKIEWTQKTWNPVTGCDKISQGCKYCYAEVMAKRLMAMGNQQYKDGFKLALAPQALDTPRKWKKPVMVFVNSMSDLFHKDVPLSYIQDVFKVMNETPHTYQVLTKRSKRLLELSPFLNWTDDIWMGVSVESEKVVDRIEDLRQTGAKVKFLSVEPLIAPVETLDLQGIDWVIAGGESGHKARPIKKEWVTFVRDRCQETSTPFFFKQWGKKKFNPDPTDPTTNKDHEYYAKGGCQLDGVMYREFPVLETA